MRRFITIALILLLIMTGMSYWALKISAEVAKKNQSLLQSFDDVSRALRATDKTFSRRFAGKLDAERFQLYLIARTAAAAERRVYPEAEGKLRTMHARNSVLRILANVLEGRKMALSEYLGIHARAESVLMADGRGIPFQLQRALENKLKQSSPRSAKYAEGLKPLAGAKDATKTELDLILLNQKKLQASMEAALLRPLLESIAAARPGKEGESE